MSRIKAYTCVICPAGTTIELYTNTRPAVGEVFQVRHIDTKKVVQDAKVTVIQDNPYKHPKYRVLAEVQSIRDGIACR